MPDTLAIVPSAILMCRGVLQVVMAQGKLPDWATCAEVESETIDLPKNFCSNSVNGLYSKMDSSFWAHDRNGAEAEQKGKNSFVATLRILFSVLGVFMLLTLVYTLITDGSPFRMDLLTPCIQHHEPSQALEKQLPEPKDKFVCLYIMNDFNSSLHHLTLVPIGLMSELNGTEVVGLLWLFIANSIPSRQARTCHDLVSVIYLSSTSHELQNVCRWLTATLVDFYINVVALAVGVVKAQTFMN
ncbi:uncharacterized protein G2W53_033693 [Senna tora]|uniref:Uncharacterized protein n=1 Tax=Senna tora TaxID=362788 RepID=A0A834T2N5_9FABA|nr:uncharacterized protein G2W53_033693 [Senna tora]